MSASTQSVMWPGLDNTAVKPQTIEQRSKNENSTLSRNTIQHESWIKRQQNHSRSFDSRRTDSQMNHSDESDSNKSSKEPLFIHKCQAKPSEQSAIPSCSVSRLLPANLELTYGGEMLSCDPRSRLGMWPYWEPSA